MFITFKYKALKEYKDTLLEDLTEDIIIVVKLEIRNIYLRINYPPALR